MICHRKSQRRSRLTAVIILCFMCVALLFSGCSQAPAELFSCSPVNIAGVSSVQYSGGHVIIYFDKEYVSSDKTPYGALQDVFEKGDGRISPVSAKLFYGENGCCDTGSVKVDRKRFTLSFSTSGIAQGDIKSVGVEFEDNCGLYIDFAKKELVFHSEVRDTPSREGPLTGPLVTHNYIYTQDYDEETGTWTPFVFEDRSVEIVT